MPMLTPDTFIQQFGFLVTLGPITLDSAQLDRIARPA